MLIGSCCQACRRFRLRAATEAAAGVTSLCPANLGDHAERLLLTVADDGLRDLAAPS